MLQLDILTGENVKSKRNFKHQILGSIPENESVHHTSTSLHQHLFIPPAGVCRCESRRRCVDLKLPSYLSSRAQISYHIEDGPCTHKHADPAMVLMQNSMFIRKIFNKHFIFFFLQRNKCKSTTKCSWILGSKIKFTGLYRVFHRSDHHPAVSLTALQAWLHLWTVHLGILLDLFISGEMGEMAAAILDQSLLVVSRGPKMAALPYTYIYWIYWIYAAPPPRPDQQKKRKEKKNTVHQLSILMF